MSRHVNLSEYLADALQEHPDVASVVPIRSSIEAALVGRLMVSALQADDLQLALEHNLFGAVFFVATDGKPYLAGIAQGTRSAGFDDTETTGVLRSQDVWGFNCRVDAPVVFRIREAVKELCKRDAPLADQP